MKKDLYFPITLLTFLALLNINCRKESFNTTQDLKSQQLSSIKANLLNNTDVIITDAANPTEKYNTFYGPVVQMGNGHVRSWINISHNNKALAIGVELTDDALQNLPDIPEEERDFISGPADFLLPLHPKAREITAYDHICVNWNAHGHAPPGLYDIPHFDFHFYKITVAEQKSIP